MKKQSKVYYENDFQKKFVELFQTLAGRYSPHLVWQDFLVMSAQAVFHSVSHRFFYGENQCRGL